MSNIENIVFNNAKSLLIASIFSFCLGMIFCVLICLLDFDYPSKGDNSDIILKCIIGVFFIAMSIALFFYLKHAYKLFKLTDEYAREVWKKYNDDPLLKANDFGEIVKAVMNREITEHNDDD